MKCLVLASVRAGIPHDDHLTRQALENFESYVSAVDAFGQLSAHPSYDKFTGGSLRKWRATAARRIVYATLSTPVRKTPYVVVVAADPHQTYEEKLKAEYFRRYSIDSLRKLPEVRDFVAGLDAVVDSRPVIPSGHIGLTQPLAVFEPVAGDRVLEESAGYVERVLSLVSAGRNVSQGGVSDLVGPVLDAVVNRRNDVVDVVGTRVRVTCSGNSVCVSLDDESEVVVRRRVPLKSSADMLGYLLECEAASAAQVDPFMVWDESQRKLLVELGSAPRSLPAFVDGPGGSGKTAILMWLVRGVMQHRDWYVPGTRVRLVTASPLLASRLEEGLRNHLGLVDGYPPGESSDIASDVCRTVDNYLLEFIADSDRHHFDSSSKVDWRAFHNWYNGLHSPGPLTPHEAWCSIRILIRGDSIGREDPRFEVSASDFETHLVTWFRGLNERRRQGIEDDQFRASLEVHRRYTDWKSSAGMWDDADLVRAAHESLASPSVRAPSADMLVVDEAQDLTPDALRLMVRTCGAARQRIDVLAAEGKPVRIPLVFAADDLQTINPSGFDWGGFRAVFHDETAEILNSPVGINVEPVGLDVNFRMRESVHGVAHSLRRWMRPSTPATPPEARRKGGYSGPCRTRSADVLSMLLSQVERVIIPRDLDSYAGDAPLRKFLENLHLNLEERVLPVGMSKGDEFSTVALVGFAENVRQASGVQEEKFAKQLTYVAASRARDAAVWVEVSDEDLDWFWESGDHRSPATVLPYVKDFSPEELDPFRVSSEQMIVRELQRIRRIIAESEEDDSSRQAQMANAAGGLRSAGAGDMADAAFMISRYFAGDRERFSFGVLPGEIDDVFTQMAVRDEAWAVFDGPHEGEVPLDVLGGWAVSGLGRRSTDELLRACAALDDAGFSRALDLDERIARELASAGRFLAEVLESAAVAGDTSLIDAITPAELNVLDVLADGMMLNEVFTIFRDWAQGHLPSALKGCARLASIGNVDIALAVNRRIVAVETGVPWIARNRVKEAAVSPRMAEQQVLEALDDACMRLCGLDEVKRRFATDLAEGTDRYTDAQLLRYMLTTALEGAESLESINKEYHDVT